MEESRKVKENLKESKNRKLILKFGVTDTRNGNFCRASTSTEAESNAAKKIRLENAKENARMRRLVEDTSKKEKRLNAEKERARKKRRNENVLQKEERSKKAKENARECRLAENAEEGLLEK